VACCFGQVPNLRLSLSEITVRSLSVRVSSSSSSPLLNYPPAAYYCGACRCLACCSPLLVATPGRVLLARCLCSCWPVPDFTFLTKATLSQHALMPIISASRHC
jgi:hypothetical protein